MYPVLFEIGPVPVRAYGLLLVIGFLVGITIARKRAAARGVDPEKIWDISFWLILAGILGARVLFIAQEWSHYSKNMNEILSLQFNGLTSFGGLIFGGLALLFLVKRHKLPLATIADVYGIPVLVAHALGRMGCLLHGCCYGHKTDHWFAVHIVGEPGHYVPAQIYDALMCLVAVGSVLLFERRPGNRAGQSFALAMVGWNISRFIYEFWRAGETSTYMGATKITDAQALALAMAAIFAVVFFLAGRKEPRTQ
jgi:phosphatidylglycerol---prolipoprotein diacylglyceryl transferase